LRAEDLEFRGFGSRFTVVDDMQPLGEIELRVPGAMNVQNALAAIAVGRVLQLPFATTAQALRGFGGVRRRFDILLATDRVIIVDDYAHHPTAVRATIAAARRYHEGALIVAFQPHRFTRTAYLAHEFADALQAADRVYLTPVYAASEPAIPGVSERSIGERIARKSLLGTEDGSVRYVESVDDLERRILDEAPPGAMVLMLGAGNITDVAARMAQAARV
jgi:UDP-N-acetylmuramate--alanine ligase